MLVRMNEAERLKSKGSDYELGDDDYFDWYIFHGDVDSIVDCLEEQLLHYVNKNLSKKWNGSFHVITENGYIVKYYYLTSSSNISELAYFEEIKGEILTLMRKFKEDL